MNQFQAMEMNMDMMNGMCMLMCRSFPCAKKLNAVSFVWIVEN